MNVSVCDFNAIDYYILSRCVLLFNAFLCYYWNFLKAKIPLFLPHRKVISPCYASSYFPSLPPTTWLLVFVAVLFLSASNCVFLHYKTFYVYTPGRPREFSCTIDCILREFCKRSWIVFEGLVKYPTSDK